MSTKQDYSSAIWQLLRHGRQLRREDYRDGDFVFFSSKSQQVAGFGFIKAGGIASQLGSEAALQLDEGAELAYYNRPDADSAVNAWRYRDEVFKLNEDALAFSYHEDEPPVEGDIILMDNGQRLPLLSQWREGLSQVLREGEGYWLVRVFQRGPAVGAQ